MENIDEKKWLRLHNLANVKRTKDVWNFYRAAGLEPLLLKGWSVSRFYDEPTRAYNDVDLAFDPEVMAAVVCQEEELHRSRLSADLHFGLRHLDLLPWEQVYGESYLVDIDGVPIRVLADEDNLRVTAVHWLRDGGVKGERLWDIYYLVKNRKADFNWERCLEANGPVRKTWVLAAIATARDHLQLDVAGLPEEALNFELPEWYKETLEKEWDRGPYIRRVMSSVVTHPKLLIEQFRRRFPPNRIAATVDTETPIDNSSRIFPQIKSLTKKVGPFARGVGRRLTYRR